LLSPIYTDNRLLISHPGAWRVVVDGLVDILSNQVGLSSLDVLAGTATSGIPHAALLADRLSLPLVYVDGSNTDWSSVKGEPRTGTRIVIVEDHVTTGSSVLESVALLRDRGARVDWCLAIFTYNMQRARERFEAMNLRLASLCDLNTLLDTAVEDGTIAASARSIVLDWVRDPQAWSALAETRGLAPEHR
jgi:orotate phosphoribosyltransferase